MARHVETAHECEDCQFVWHTEEEANRCHHPIPLSQFGRICMDDSKLYFPGRLNNDIGYHILALTGEAGELANIIKKVIRGSLPFPKPHKSVGGTGNDDEAEVYSMLVEEATDVLIYLGNIYGILQADPDMSFKIKRQFNHDRFIAQEPSPLDKLHIPGREN